MKKVTVHSDGYGNNTFIVDEDGNKIEGVIGAVIRMEPREPNRLELEIMMPRVQATATVREVTFVCICCGETLSHECGPTTLSGT